MAKKIKTPAEQSPTNEAAPAATNGKADAPAPKKKSRAAATAPKQKKPAPARKKSGDQEKASKPKPAVSARREPTEDEIRIRAYFIAERRHRLSLPGDSNHDWIEARRQLIEEAGR